MCDRPCPRESGCSSCWGCATCGAMHPCACPKPADRAIPTSGAVTRTPRDWQCQECGKRLTMQQADRAMSVGCPKCGGVDVDLVVSEGSKPADRAPARHSNRKRYHWSMAFSGRYTLRDATVPVTIIRVRRASRRAIGNYRGQPPLWDVYVGNECVGRSLESFGAAEALVPASAFELLPSAIVAPNAAQLLAGNAR